METRLPAPSLVVLVGPSASGKTTWTLEHFAQNEVISSDALRAMAGTGADDQQAGTTAFELLEQIVDERLGRELTTVIDTLGFDQKRRAGWIQRARQAGIPAYAVLFDTPGEECERRNALRDRPIPKTVLRKQVARFAKVSDAIADEGFDRVLNEQAVAVVAPQFIQEQAVETISDAGHTFGLMISRFDWQGERSERAPQLASIARRAEDAGFRDLWVMDHFRQIPQVGRAWEDMPESYTALAYLAGVTSTIRLGALVAGITYRNPVHLGKIVATLDALSGGRANCGIGAAWDEAEHRAYGWDFPPTSDRYELLEDTLKMLPLLWGKGSPRFEGKVIHADELVTRARFRSTSRSSLGDRGRRRRSDSSPSTQTPATCLVIPTGSDTRSMFSSVIAQQSTATPAKSRSPTSPARSSHGTATRSGNGWSSCAAVIPRPNRSPIATPPGRRTTTPSFSRRTPTPGPHTRSSLCPTCTSTGASRRSAT